MCPAVSLRRPLRLFTPCYFLIKKGLELEATVTENPSIPDISEDV
jgi:hypothetical protein